MFDEQPEAASVICAERLSERRGAISHTRLCSSDLSARCSLKNKDPLGVCVREALPDGVYVRIYVCV